MHSGLKKKLTYMDLTRKIIASEKPEVINQQLDQIINTTRIFYESRDDFEKNFPAPDDISGKVELIINRRE